MKPLYNLLIFFSAIIVSSQSYSLRIIPHLTLGPASLQAMGASSKLSGPSPTLPGSITALDCKAVKETLGNNLTSAQTGSLCLAIASIEKYVKNDVTIELEFYRVNFPVTGAPPGVIGAAILKYQYFVSPENNPNLKANHGYNKMVHLLKTASAKESDKDPITNHLPNLNQLSATLPDAPFFNNFKPISVAATHSQLKAFGVKPSNAFKLLDETITPLPVLTTTLPNMDGGFTLGDDTTDPTIFWDLNPTDDVGLKGPFTREEYNLFRFNDASTLPPGFFPNFPSTAPAMLDFIQVISHEIIHDMGVISKIDNNIPNDIVHPNFPNLPRENQYVTIMDLFRVAGDQTHTINSMNDFTKLSRYWVSGSLGNTCSASLGNAVFIADVTQEGPEIINLSSGSRGKDARQSSHLRSPFDIVRINANCTGTLIGHSFYSAFPGPSMRPAHGTQVSAKSFDPLTHEDLRVLDIVGWDIDYTGSQPTSLEAGASLENNQDLQSADDIANQNGPGTVIYESHSNLIE